MDCRPGWGLCFSHCRFWQLRIVWRFQQSVDPRFAQRLRSPRHWDGHCGRMFQYIYIYILYKCIVFICDIYLSYLREHCHKKSPPWNCLSSIDAIVEYCWHVTFANLTLPKMQTMILLSPSSFFANRHWPILTASLQNPKRSWWRVAIWEWSWAWTVYLSPRSCWLHVLNKLGFLHLGRAIFKASCALTSHWKTIGRLYR